MILIILLPSDNQTGGLIFVRKETRHHLWIGGRQLANIVFANIRRRSILDAMGSRDKRQPNCQFLLPGSAIGEKKYFVGKESRVDLPQQFTSVLGRGVTGNGNLFRLSQSKIESGTKGWYRVRF